MTVWRDGERSEMEAVLADPNDPSLEDWFASARPEAAPIEEVIPEAPEDIASLTSELVRVQRMIHVSGLPSDVPDLVSRLQRKVSACTAIDAADRSEAATAVDRLPRGAALLHGDLHPGNVLMGSDGPVVIDWFDAAVEQGRDLGIGVDLDEAAGKLVALTNADQPGIVLGCGMAQGKQLFKGNGDLDAIGCCQGIQLQRVLAQRQVLVVRRAGNRAGDAGELAAGGCPVAPDLGGYIGGGCPSLKTLPWPERSR